jgi:DNA-binding NtrC family response regulator
VLERFEAEYLSRLLSDTKGNVSLAARRAQMDRSYLIKLLQRHRLKASKESE